jgi:hypothetical protein
MPPSFLIVSPALVALVLFMRRYYFISPVRRLADPNFLGGAACLAVSFAYIWLHAFGIGDPVLPDVSCLLTWALLVVAVLLTILRPPVFEDAPGHSPE